jgi:hypothetical protein
MKTERLRAYLLEVGDEFIMFDRRYRVVAIRKGVINYLAVDSDDCATGSRRNQMSKNSRQRIELICKPKSPVCDD